LKKITVIIFQKQKQIVRKHQRSNAWEEAGLYWSFSQIAGLYWTKKKSGAILVEKAGL
jgi:hypothetical protein